MTANGRKAWVYRYMLNSARHEVAIGPVDFYGLAEAREKALAYRKLKHGGTDPLSAKRDDQAKRRAAACTFAQCLDMYIQSHGAAWTHRARMTAEWTNSLATYAKPLMTMPIAAIDSAAVLKVLKPIWNSHTKIATRVRVRIENVLGYAGSHGLRDATLPNVARWGGFLEHLLPKASDITEKAHHAALPFTDIGGSCTNSGARPATFRAPWRW